MTARDTFWQTIDSIGWGTKTTNCKAVKARLMRQGEELCSLLSDEYGKVLGELYRAARDAGFDLCCDSWDDTKAHVVGLGRDEFERCLADPEQLVRRMDRGNYTESFSYCIPYPGDFEMYSAPKLRERAERFARDYTEALGRVPEVDADVKRLVKLLTGDLLGHQDEARALAESIEDRARDAIHKAAGGGIIWAGGDLLTNRWGVWNLLTDLWFAAEVTPDQFAVGDASWGALS